MRGHTVYPGINGCFTEQLSNPEALSNDVWRCIHGPRCSNRNLSDLVAELQQITDNVGEVSAMSGTAPYSVSKRNLSSMVRLASFQSLSNVGVIRLDLPTHGSELMYSPHKIAWTLYSEHNC